MPKKKSAPTELEPKYSKQSRHIIIACAWLILTVAIFLSTEPGQRMLGFNPEAVSSSASENITSPVQPTDYTQRKITNDQRCSKTYASTIAGGSVSYHPTSGFAGQAGAYSGILTSESGAKVSLEKKQGKNWNSVAYSNGFTTSELVTYSGNKGTYRWKVEATNTTTYSLCARLP